MTEAKTAKKISKIEEGINKNYLQDKSVILKPITRKGKMINDKTHSSYFMVEGAQISWCIPKTPRGAYVNIFKSEEERDYFEDVLGVDLNPISENGKKFYKETRVKFLKNPSSMFSGEKYDLMVPMENIKIRILKANDDIAPSWEKRKARPYYKFAIVDEHYEDDKVAKKVDTQQRVWMYMGSLMESKRKMSEFLEVYLLSTRSGKLVPEDADIDWLKTELNKIIETDQANFVKLMDDPKIDAKMFILQALKVGAISKVSANSYEIPGVEIKYSFNELVDFMISAKGVDDVYFKIEGQIKASK